MLYFLFTFFVIYLFLNYLCKLLVPLFSRSWTWVVVKALVLMLPAGIMVSFIIQLHSIPLIQKWSLGLNLDLDFPCLIKNYLNYPLRFQKMMRVTQRRKIWNKHHLPVVSLMQKLLLVVNLVASLAQKLEALGPMWLANPILPPSLMFWPTNSECFASHILPFTFAWRDEVVLVLNRCWWALHSWSTYMLQSVLLSIVSFLINSDMVFKLAIIIKEGFTFLFNRDSPCLQSRENSPSRNKFLNLIKLLLFSKILFFFWIIYFIPCPNTQIGKNI